MQNTLVLNWECRYTLSNCLSADRQQEPLEKYAMNVEAEDKKQKGDPVRLVWLITLLSFSVGAFMVYLVWSTFTDLRTDRDKLFE